MTTLGVLTGGGDCPGLNAVIRAVTRAAFARGWQVLGIRNGWRGLIDDVTTPFSTFSVAGIISLGGTILGTSRTDPFREVGDVERIRRTIALHGIDALVVIGGDGTLRVAEMMYRLEGIPLVSVPKTIDNDIRGTDVTVGFDTAVSIVTDAIDRLHTTAESHHRIMVVEVMGRDAGWIAVVGGVAGGADEILIPEVPFDMTTVCAHLKSRYDSGRNSSIVVVAEGARPEDPETFTTGSVARDSTGQECIMGIGTLVGMEIQARLGVETRVTVLGHVQRGGSPTPYDRVIATRFGVRAVGAVAEGRFGVMTALRKNEITLVPLSGVVQGNRRADLDLYRMAGLFSGR